MNTTTKTHTAPAVALRRLLTSVLVTLLAVAGVALSAQPAAAATSISYCFRTSNGAPYAVQTTSIYAWNGQSWQLVAYDRTGSTGCSSVSIAPWRNHYVKVVAGTFTSRHRGETPLMANPGNSAGVHLGTGYVYLSY